MRETASHGGSVVSRCYSADDVAQLLGMSTRWVQYQAKQGRLPCLMLGRRVLFPRDKIDALIASQQHIAPPPGATPPAAPAAAGA